ncbi:MAG: acetyl-CoA carboxylase biotin carboxyl carrier protein [Erysipelotrichaceae bacterium]
MEIKEIESIMKLFEASKVSKMELELEEFKIKLEKNTGEVVVNYPAAQSVAYTNTNSGAAGMVVAAPTAPAVDTANYVKAPIVGTYYGARSPKAKPLVKVGDKIKVGQVVAIIEAMKVMNEIKSKEAGIVSEICIKDEDMVEYNQNLIRLGQAND